MTNALPSISIVTPSYNQAEFLECCLRSVLDQSYPDLEYVVMDGGSEDGSADLIRRYADKLSSFEIEKDKGHADALNRGFARTSGEIMGWLNSDDMYLPWTLRVVGEIFSQHPDVEWISGLNGTWTRHGVMSEAFKSRKNRYDFLLGDYAWIQQESVFWRRSLWERTGSAISEDVEYMVDGELWSRFFLEAELYHVTALLAGFRKYGDNRSLVHAGACHREMRSSIAKMESHSPSRVLENCRCFRKVRRVLDRPIPGRWRFIYPKLRGRYASAFADAAYTDLTYDGKAWVKEKRSFEVRASASLPKRFQ